MSPVDQDLFRPEKKVKKLQKLGLHVASCKARRTASRSWGSHCKSNAQCLLLAVCAVCMDCSQIAAQNDTTGVYSTGSERQIRIHCITRKSSRQECYPRTRTRKSAQMGRNFGAMFPNPSFLSSAHHPSKTKLFPAPLLSALNTLGTLPARKATRSQMPPHLKHYSVTIDRLLEHRLHDGKLSSRRLSKSEDVSEAVDIAWTC